MKKTLSMFLLGGVLGAAAAPIFRTGPPSAAKSRPGAIWISARSN